jgi:hypothetical protein
MITPSALVGNLGTNDNPVPLAIGTKKFPKLNFACQNVCSLNISKPNKKTHNKLIMVTRSGADVIFLSDTRLNSDKQIAGVNDIVKKIRFMGYYSITTPEKIVEVLQSCYLIALTMQ